MKKTFLIVLVSVLVGCSATYRITDQEQIENANHEAYISFVVDTLDSLYNLHWRNMETGEYFYVGSAPKGVTQITFPAQEGEYCFVGFSVYSLKVDYKEKGLCLFAEKGELNYMGDLYVRNPVTTHQSNFRRFHKLLVKELPLLCQRYIGEDCDA